jgi:hypothetical protein
VGRNIFYLDRHDITATQLAIDGQVEHRKIARSTSTIGF